jgi:hypothetical protein
VNSAKKNYLSLGQLFGATFVAFMLIPWVNFGLNSRDSQIWPLLFGLVFLALHFRVRLNINYLYFFIIPIFALFVWFFYSELNYAGPSGFTAIRAILSYSSFSVCLVGFLMYLKSKSFPWKIFYTVNFLYLFIAVIQLFIPEIVSSIVSTRDITFSNVATVARGVTSLTPEPTFFGIFLYFLCFIYLVQCDFKPDRFLTFVLLLNFFAIIFLSRSSMMILYLLVSLPVLFIRLKLFHTFLILFFGAVFIFVTLQIFSETRMVRLFELLYELGPSSLILIDESVNDRVAHVVFPIHGSILNDLMPGGFHSWGNMHTELVLLWDGIFWYINAGPIMSFFGLYIYELGIIGAIFLLFIFLSIQDGSFSRLTESIVLFIILNSSIPPSFPLLPILIGLYLKKNELKKS